MIPAAPTVSVIIPTYNHRDHVMETLESVFAQTFTDYEVIVVNDGSPDDTAEVLRPLVESGRIRYIDQSNTGQAGARNRGLALARGAFVALLDDDDLWPPDKLEWQLAILQARADLVLAYGYATRLDDDALHSPPIHAAPSGDTRDAFVGGTWISSPGQTLIRTDAMRKIGGFDARVWGTDDWDLYIRLSRLGAFQFGNKCALKYRVHGANASKQWWRMYLNARQVTRKNFPFSVRPRELWRWHASRKWLAYTTAAGLVRAARETNPDAIWNAVGLCAASLYVRPGAVLRRSHWKAMFAAIRGLLLRQETVTDPPVKNTSDA